MDNTAVAEGYGMRRVQIGFNLDRTSPGGKDVLEMHEEHLALGADLAEMLAEVDRHIDLGIELIRSMSSASGSDVPPA
jgi:hypothetical protein